MDELTVCEATPEDAPGIRRVGRRAWEAAYGSFLPGETIDRIVAEWYDPAFVRRVVEREGTAYVVACDPAVVGYAAGSVDDEDGNGNGHRALRRPRPLGAGIGTRLFERVLDALRQEGAERVEIEVFAANDVGRSFYESRGFDPVGTDEGDLFGEAVDAVTAVGRL